MSENEKKNLSKFQSFSFFVEVIKSEKSNVKTYIVRCPRPDGSASVCSFGIYKEFCEFFDSL